MSNIKKHASYNPNHLDTTTNTTQPEYISWNLSLIYKTTRRAYQEIIRMDLIIEHFQRHFVCSHSRMLLLAYEYRDIITELRDKISFYFKLLSFTDQRYGVVRSYVNSKADAFTRIFKQKAVYIEHDWDGEVESVYIREMVDRKSRELRRFCKRKLKNHRSTLKLNHLLKKYHKNKCKGKITPDSFYKKYFDMCNKHEFSFASEYSGSETLVSKTNFQEFSKHPDQAVRKEVYQKKLISLKKIESDLFDNYSHFMHHSFAEKSFGDFLSENKISCDYYHSIIQLCKENTHIQDQFNELKKRELSLCKTGLWDDVLFRGSQLSLKEIKKLLRRPLQKLGLRYIEHYDSIMRSNCLAVASDYFQKENPTHHSSSLIKPSYIMLQSTQNVYDLLILAHEIGHSVHHRFNPRYSNDKLKKRIFSEMIASVNMELLFQYYKLNPQKSTAFNRSLCQSYLLRKVNKLKLFPTHCEFQRIQIEELREKGSLPSPRQLSSLYYSLYKKFCGCEEEVNYMFGMDWLNLNLLYDPFYYFAYIPANIYAYHVVKKILKDEDYIDNYLGVLESQQDCSLSKLMESLDIMDSSQELTKGYLNHLSSVMTDMTTNP